MAASNTFPISFPGKSSPACPASPFPPGGRLPPNGDSRTPTLMRASGGRSPLYQQHHSGGRNAGSASTGHVNGNGLLLQVPHMLGYHNQRASSPSSPRNSIHDRLIPCRAQTDMQLAQHLLSPLSAPSSLMGSNSKEPNAQQMIDEDASPNHRSSVNRILQFGRNPIQGRAAQQSSRPLSLVTHSSAGGMSSRLGKVKIPTKPDRVMAAPGTFLECGSQSAQWAPSSNLVVALESGVYVCRINEDCNVVEIGNNGLEPENPFCHVIWNADGNAVICGKMSGEVKICDIRQSQALPRRIEWGLHLKQTLRSIALEQEHLLTCGGLGVKIYDLRQIGGTQQLQEPMISLKSRSSTVNSVSWSPNGHMLAGGCENGMTYLWDVRHPAKEMIALKQQQNNSVQVVNWCNWKSSILLTGSSFPRPTICVHNTATGVLLNQVDCASEVTGIQFNAQLKQVATSHHSVVSDSSGTPIEIGTTQGAESSVQLWQLSSHKLCPLMQLGQHEEGIVAMSSSVNGHQLLTMGGDELLCLWHWSETVQQNASKAGPLTVRSLLNPANLIR